MEEILIILSLVTLVIVAGIKGFIQKKTNLLNQKLDFLYKEMTDLKELLAKTASGGQTPTEEPLTEPEKDLVKDIVDERMEDEQDELNPESLVVESETEETVYHAAYTYTRPSEEELNQAASPEPAEIISKKIKEPTPSFWQRNPDLEKFIGENLFNKIGIAILVIGMGFFLKYAIDKDWINEIGRAFIGLLCGGALIALAHRLRKSFAAFSSVLIGGGIAILYYTISISFQEYHLMNQTVAFILLIVITMFTVLLSLRYDRKELAILAILGGFSSPFMVNTGSGHYVVLFTYILLLNMGMLVLAYFKRWNLVTIVSFAATVILFVAWLADSVIGKLSAPYSGALAFATLFYLVFLAMTVINNIRAKTKFNALEISMLLANTFLYLGAGLLLLTYIDQGQYRGLFVALMAMLNFCFAYTLYKNGRADKILVYLFIGLVLTFVSLIAPIQLEGHYITLFWASEAVLLLWLSEKAGLDMLRKSSFLVLFLMLMSLLMDWQLYYQDGSHQVHRFPIVNRAFMTSVFAVLGISLFRFLYNKNILHEPNNTTETAVPNDWGITARQLQLPFQLLILFVLYVGILFELNDQVGYYAPQVQGLSNGVFHYILLSCLLFRMKSQSAFILPITVCLAIFFLLLYPMWYNGEVIAVRMEYLFERMSIGYFMLHYVLIAGFIACLLGIKRQLASLKLKQGKEFFAWAACFLLVYLASAELDHLLLLAKFREVQDVGTILYESHGVGYAILWGISSFLLMYFGMRWKSRTIRIISITLFGITLLKLFVVDLRGLSEGGKIAAFLSLGVLLLIISFMYQRLKLLLLKDEPQLSGGNADLKNDDDV